MKEQVNLTYLAAHPDICHCLASSIQRSTAVEAINNRGLKGLGQYGIYFAGMWAYGLVYPEQADIIRSSYFWFRHIDDVADGDRALPSGYENKQQFLQEKKTLAQNLFFNPGQELWGRKEDILLVDYWNVSKRLRIGLGEESLAILDTIIFDEERARHRRVLTQRELNGYFDALDFACASGALKVAKEVVDCKDLSSLGRAVRTMFNLRDFPKDFARGIINISREDVDWYTVDLSRAREFKTVLEIVKYQPLRIWYKDQIYRGLNLLEDGIQEINESHLHWVTRFALLNRFAGPTEKVLKGYQRMLAA